MIVRWLLVALIVGGLAGCDSQLTDVGNFETKAEEESYLSERMVGWLEAALKPDQAPSLELSPGLCEPTQLVSTTVYATAVVPHGKEAAIQVADWLVENESATDSRTVEGTIPSVVTMFVTIDGDRWIIDGVDGTEGKVSIGTTSGCYDAE